MAGEELASTGFAGFSMVWGALKIILYIVVTLIIAGSLTFVAILFAKHLSQTKIVEIDMNTKRVRMFTGRQKKTSKGISQFYAAKIRRFLPTFESKDKFIKGKQDTVLLLKDNNGLYHTLRIPTYKQIKKWYKVVFDIDITKASDKENLRHIYTMPNPHEDIDWLANQVVEARREFKSDSWLSSPVVAYVGMGFVCMIMLFGTIILAGRL